MSRVRLAITSVIAAMSLSVSACSDERDADAKMPSAVDCYETWRGAGQTWVTMPLRKGLEPSERPGFIGRPLELREGDCPEGLRPGGRTLTLRRLISVDPDTALFAPAEPGYQRRLFVPLDYRAAPDDRPDVPASVRNLLRRYSQSK